MRHNAENSEQVKHKNHVGPQVPLETLVSAWIGTDDCMAHSSDWQYWERGKRHCLGCLRDSWRAGSGELIRLAGDMVRCGGMPSPYRDDWPKRLRWAQVEYVADQANGVAKRWAMRLRSIVDSIHGR